MRRVKEVQAVAPDDPDGYDEDKYLFLPLFKMCIPYGSLNIPIEMSPGDRESMRKATIDVKAAINGDFTVTDEEIQESLWYYYFDVDKTVNYLRGIYISYARMNFWNSWRIIGKQKPKQTKHKS